MVARRSQISCRSYRWRGEAFALVLGAVTVALSLGATSADAIVARIGGHVYGVTPIRDVNALRLPGAYRAPAGPRNYDGLPKGGEPLLNHGARSCTA